MVAVKGSSAPLFKEFALLGNSSSTPTLEYMQYFYLVTKHDVVLGCRPADTVNQDIVRAYLCPREPNSPLQLWRRTRQGRLRNQAGYILEVQT
jgi:hypothetical protein